MPFVKTLFSPIVLLALPLAAHAADLRVTVTNGPATPATLNIALYDSAETFASSTRAVAQARVDFVDGAAQWVFTGLPAGRYAIKSFADENGNARLDTNIVGLPTERYGFSNNARGRLGPPGFDAAAVQVVDVEGVDSNSITLKLQ